MSKYIEYQIVDGIMQSNEVEIHDINMALSEAEKLWTVKMKKNTMEVSDYRGNEKVIVVPTTIDSIPVTKVKDILKDKVKKDSIEEIQVLCDVDSFKSKEFNGYKGLKKIVLKKDIPIQENLFQYCNNLVDRNGFCIIGGQVHAKRKKGNVIISEGISDIPYRFLGNSVTDFSQPMDITTLVIPEGVETIGICAFAYNPNLVSVQFPKSLKKIDRSAFEGCKNLMELNIDLRDNDIEIEDDAFAYCYSLVDENGFLIVNGELACYLGYKQEVTIPNEVKVIQREVGFRQHPEIKVINAPKDCVVNSNPFRGMTGLVDDNDIISINGTMYDYVGHSACLTIPEYINKIAKWALDNEYLQEVIINKNVKFVSGDCFGDRTTSWKNPKPRIILDNYVPQTDASGGHYAFVSEFNKNSDNGLYVVDKVLLHAETNDEKLIVPDGIKRICPYAFASCHANTIVLPKSIERLDECALTFGKEYIFEGDVESIDKRFCVKPGSEDKVSIKAKKGTNIEKLSLENLDQIAFISVE